MPSNDSWGIEVGANAIKAVRLVSDADGITVAAYDVIPFKKVLTTPDMNVDEAIQVGLDQLLAKHDLNRKSVVVSVPGHMAFARFAKLPPVEPKEIPNIVKFEAVQQIPFPIEQVEWDYQVFMEDDSPDVEVAIFAIAKERVATFLSNYNRMGINLDALTMSPIAVLNAFAHDMDLMKSKEGSIIMDIGTTSTDLIVVESGRVWLRTMPIGGNNFTEALVKAFKLSFPKAEKLKREASTSKYARQIFQAMRPVFADLVQEIQRSLGFYQQGNREAELHRLIGVGSTFRLPGLQKFLKQQLQVEVIRPDGYRKLRVDGKQAADFSENALNLATAYGLALQGLGIEEVSANILPETIIKARLWKKKQPWIGAAAAVILASVVGSWVTLSSARSSYEAARAKTDKAVAPAITLAESLRTKINAVQGQDPRNTIDNYQRLLDYRDLWPKLMDDLGNAARELKTQPQLLTVDYAAHAAIDRRDRRRMFVESFSAEYIVPTADAAGGATAGAANAVQAQRYDAAEAFGGPRATPAPTAVPEQQAVTPPADDATKERPYFLVTITGTTPFAKNTAQFLGEHFLGWLKKNFDRHDRPYKFVVESVRLADLKQVVLTDKQKTETGGNIRRGPVPEEGPGPRRGAIRPGGGLVPGGLVPGGAQPNQPDDAVVDSGLFPVRPLSDEPVETDSRFVIQWRVELRSPDEVRQREDAARHVDTPAEPPPAPVAPTPSASSTDSVPSTAAADLK
ncbi:MAG: type IV pilus assembly protein PilM [Phycisphaeraceae bacterium]